MKNWKKLIKEEFITDFLITRNYKFWDLSEILAVIQQYNTKEDYFHNSSLLNRQIPIISMNC